MRTGQSKIYDEAFLKLLLDLIEIVDSFDQLAKMARLANMLYSPVELEFTTLHEAIRKTYAHLRKVPAFGRERGGSHWDNTPAIPCTCHSGPGPAGHDGPEGEPGHQGVATGPLATFTPACSAMHCPCPAGHPCDREAM